MSSNPRRQKPLKAPEKDPLLVFVHIQKTAGKTLRQILYRQYTRGHTRLVRNYFVAPDVSRNVVKGLAAEPPEDLRVIHGHILFWPDIEWPEGTQFLTILRDPVERVISHYYWNRARSSRFRKTLEDAVIGGSVPDNLQTRVLAAQMPPFGEATDEMLEEALRSLKRITVVGLTERFDESFVLATRSLGWRRMLYRKENVTPDRKPQDEISSKAIDLIQRYNALDIELYRSATKRFEREVESQGDGFLIEVEALQRANELVAGTPEDAPLPPLPSTIDDANGPEVGELDLRELLIESQAELLQRDAAIEYLTSVSTPRGEKAVATRTRKRETPVDQRKAALDAAVNGRRPGWITCVRRSAPSKRKAAGRRREARVATAGRGDDGRAPSRVSSAVAESSRTGALAEGRPAPPRSVERGGLPPERRARRPERDRAGRRRLRQVPERCRRSTPGRSPRSGSLRPAVRPSRGDDEGRRFAALRARHAGGASGTSSTSLSASRSLIPAVESVDSRRRRAAGTRT